MESHLLRKVSREQLIISIYQSAVLAPGRKDARITSRARALIKLLLVQDAWEIRLENTFELVSIWRPIIDDDDFKIREGLAKDRVDRLADRSAALVSGDHDTYQYWRRRCNINDRADAA